MVYVPSAESHGFSLRLDEDEMRRVLNSEPVRQVVAETMSAVQEQIVATVRAAASASAAENYVASMFREDAFSDDYGFEFDGPYGLGNRPIAVVGVPAGRGPNPDAMPPLMVEARTHALTSVAGFETGQESEDVR